MKTPRYYRTTYIASLLFLAVASSPPGASAGQDVDLIAFEAGQPIRASEINQNFEALEASIGSRYQRVHYANIGNHDLADMDGVSIPVDIPDSILDFQTCSDTELIRITYSVTTGAHHTVPMALGSTCTWRILVNGQACRTFKHTASLTDFAGIQSPSTAIGLCAGPGNQGYPAGTDISVTVEWEKNDESLVCEVRGGMLEAVEI